MKFLGNFFRNKRAGPPLEHSEGFTSAARQRLARGAALLRQLELERESRDDPAFGRAAEERIIWRELFDLELQEVDEQITRRARESDWA